MALLFIDLFAANTDTAGKWTANGFTQRQAGGRNGSLCATVDYGSATATKTFTTNYDTLIVGIDFYCTNWSDLTIQFYDGTTLNGWAYLKGYTNISAFYAKVYNSSSVEVGTYALTADLFNRWSYFEVKMTFGDSAAAIVKLEGVEIITLTGKDFKGGANAYSNKVSIIANGDNPKRINTVYMCDTSGSYCNNFLGVQTGTVIVPTSDVSSTFSKSTGSDAYALVDEQPQNQTDYVLSNVAALDKFNLGDVSLDLTTIRGIQANLYCKEDTIGTDPNLHLHNVIYGSLGNETKGTQIDPTPTYKTFSDIWMVDPDTGTLFTPTTINSLLGGYRLE